MRVSVLLFGRFEVTVDQQPRSVTGQTERRLLARLCVSPEAFVSRLDLAEGLWPDVDYTVAGNRLRTGLVGLRKCLAPAEPVLADRQKIGLHSEILTDIQLARDAEARVRRALDHRETEKALEFLVDATREDLLPGWTDAWAVGARQRWRKQYVNACLRLARFALERDDAKGASDWARQAVSRDPYFGESWIVYLRSMAAQGRGTEAARAFTDAKKTFGLTGGEWADVADLATSAKRGALGPGTAGLTYGESDLVLRAFGRMMSEEPELAARIVSSTSFGHEVDQEPRHVFGLLERLYDPTADTDLAVPLRVVAIRAHGLLNQRQQTLETGAWLLAHDDDPGRILGTHTMLSVAYLVGREMEPALSHAEKALEMARALGPERRVFRALAQRGVVLWHQGRTAQALAGLLEAYERLSRDPVDATTVVPAAIAVNLGSLYAMNGNETEALAWLARSRARATSVEFSNLEIHAEPPAGFASAVLGQNAAAARATIVGLVACLRRSANLELLIALDFAAGVLAILGWPGEAVAVLESAARFRSELQSLRSPAEEAFVQRVIQLADGTPPAGAWEEFTKPTQLVRAIISKLEG